MASRRAALALKALERDARRYGPGLAARKLARLSVLAVARLGSAPQLRRLHEILCFLDAYPDDRRIRGRVRRMLRGFSRRPDLRRHRAALAGTGIAGTDTPYRFFWPTAQWIASNWPGALVLDRDDEEATREILAALPQLLEPAQAEWLIAQHAVDLAPLARLLPRGMTDADFLISLIAAMPGDDFSREAFGDRLDMSYLLRAGRSTPERTTARFNRSRIAFQSGALPEGYPDLRVEARRGPRRVRPLRGSDAKAAIRLARISMITRERDVAAFQFANPRDVFLIEDDHGLAFAMMGMIPVRRATLPATYTALTLKNGVPVGYIQVEVLGRHGALSFNTFETFRGAGTAWIFARFIAAASQLFGCADFSVEPYQLGAGNDEGIDSGAWWFYHRLGFRPRAAAARRMAAREIARRAANGNYRSSARTLRTLARWHLFYSLHPRRKAELPLIQHWLAAATDASRRYGQRGPDARRKSMFVDALARLGRAQAPRLKPHQQEMLSRWASLVLALTDEGRWNASDRRQLFKLILAKAGTDELDYQRRLLRHARLSLSLGC
ncbi:MAG: hypothetical protein WAW79_06855 [Steroidobacteraceae bacterium]